MSAYKRAACLLLALLTLVSLAPEYAGADDGVCFTAVNDTLLPLADGTMPFRSGGTLYVASDVFDGTDLGLYYSRSRDRETVVLYRQRSVMTFDLAAGTIESSGGERVAGSALTRGETVFLPLGAVCRYFGLEYSYVRIDYGYLLRVKSDAAVLSDAAFIDAASSPMAQRYNRYMKAQTEDAAETQTPPADTQTPDTARRTVYLAVEADDAAETGWVFARLSPGRVTYLFTPEEASGADGLLRRLAAVGGVVALRVDASAGAADALARIEAGNRAIWAAANAKTRIVHLDGATRETERAVTEAGYCLLHFALDANAGSVPVSRVSANILSAADARGGSCCVFLGTASAAANMMGTLLTGLRAGNCTPARLNETTVYQR